MNQSHKSELSEERIQTSFLAKPEKKALLWMAPRIPSWISPDMLTYFGLLGLMISGISYYLAYQHWGFLILASIGMIINWLGDSLDGTLARVRNKQRPKYGYYLDHLIDAFGISFFMIGISYSNIITQPLAWIVLILFFITCINTYLATNTLKVFKISHLKISTTEARVLLIIMNIILIFCKKITLFGFTAFCLDYLAVLIILYMLIATIRSAYKNLTKLGQEERALWDK